MPLHFVYAIVAPVTQRSASPPRPTLLMAGGNRARTGLSGPAALVINPSATMLPKVTDSPIPRPTKCRTSSAWLNEFIQWPPLLVTRQSGINPAHVADRQ